MSILNNVFGGNDSESSNESDGSLVGVLDSATNLGVDYETNSSDTDEDGETTSSHRDGSLNTDLDTDSLLGGRGEGSSDSMTDTDDGGSGIL